MKMKSVLAAFFGLVLVGQLASAENLSYQFVCADDGHQTKTGWLDERISVRSFFEQGESGEQIHYCAADCSPEYGWRSCSFVVPSEEGFWGPWVTHVPSLSCDEVCINVRATDGVLNRWIDRNNIDITRYGINLDDDDPLRWYEQSHRGDDDNPDTYYNHFNSDRRLDGVTYCWNSSWNNNYWVVKYDLDNPVGGGRMTTVTLRDGDGHDHIFRAMGYSKATVAW